MISYRRIGTKRFIDVISENSLERNHFTFYEGSLFNFNIYKMQIDILHVVCHSFKFLLVRYWNLLKRKFDIETRSHVILKEDYKYGRINLLSNLFRFYLFENLCMRVSLLSLSIIRAGLSQRATILKLFTRDAIYIYIVYFFVFISVDDKNTVDLLL
jgi:hypothetical protein